MPQKFNDAKLIIHQIITDLFYLWIRHSLSLFVRGVANLVLARK